jgi:hypothetical protein
VDLAGGSTTNKDSDINWADAFASGNPFGAIPAYAVEPGRIKSGESTSDKFNAFFLKWTLKSLLTVSAALLAETGTLADVLKGMVVLAKLNNIANNFAKFMAVSLYGSDKDEALLALYFMKVAIQSATLYILYRWQWNLGAATVAVGVELMMISMATITVEDVLSRRLEF